ncbi:MAG: elongation factor G [Ilumatobacteraceae bacterium]
MVTSTRHIRNVVLVGQSGVGKTTLAEALLHRAGVTNRHGSVDDGTTALDRDPESIGRGSSVSLAVASFDWQTPDGETYRINLLDSPGHPDFVGDAEAALAVADLAVLVVSAADGVEVGTETAWRACAARDLPVFVFVTREDRPRADFEHVVADLTAAFGDGFTMLELPLGEAEAFHGVADVLDERALEYDASGHHHVEPLPDSIVRHEHEVHEHVVEEIVSGDDDQLERYLDGDEPTGRDLERTLAAEVVGRQAFPVLVGSGTTAIGVDRLADYVCEVGPSPADRATIAKDGESMIELKADPDVEPVAVVFKTVSDQYVGRVSLFRVVAGTVRADATLIDTATGSTVRLHAPFTLVGDRHTPVDTLVAGQIGAVAKLDVATGATLASSDSLSVPTPTPPSAHLAVALVPATQSDDDRLPDALQKLVQEDPSLVVEHDALSRRTVLRGVGDTHLAVALARLSGRYDIDVSTEPVRVPYRRTITRVATAEGRVKKQSGGHGQFAVVSLRVEPLACGAGIEFVDEVVGGAIPKQFVQATEAGVVDALSVGGPLGVPVVDVRVVCVDGKTHSVDSSDMAFRTAAAHGVLEAIESANAVVLEPIARLEATVPVETQGDVLGDLGARRGRIVDSRIQGDRQTITADVPLAEIQRYSMELRSLTGGRGSFTLGAIHHDVLPDHLADEVLDQYRV